jgi:hypothetical protein
MFYSGWNLAIYFSAATLLVLGVVLQTNVTAIVAIVLFLVWDVAFVVSPSSFYGRSIEDAQQQIQNTREHISYLLAFYGVLFGVLFTQESARQQEFLEMCRNSGVPLSLLVMPLVFAAVPLLFVPIRASAPDDSLKPSSSLKALFALTAFMQKCAIFVFIHVALRILTRLGSGVTG